MKISGNTRMFGILADPIHHVRTPARINALFSARQIDAAMVPLHVPAMGLEDVVRGLRQLRNLAGFVVTVPHKTAMFELCDEVTTAAARIGAVNVVRRHATGRLMGAMFDGDGFVDGLRRAGIDVAGKSIYLAGAGGAASAIAYALALAGVSRLTLANRSLDKVRNLKDRLAIHFPTLELALGTRDPSGHDIVVNATSLGLLEGDPLPLDADRLSPQQLVAEIIMHPAETPLLMAALRKGCRIQLGAPMLESQIELMAAFMGAFT